MLLMGQLVLGVYENVIQVDHYTDIEHVSEDGVDKPLECCRSVGKTKWNDMPFIGAIASVGGHLPLITLSDAH